jgi:DNA-binding XRE family transcriptional regulator
MYAKSHPLGAENQAEGYIPWTLALRTTNHVAAMRSSSVPTAFGQVLRAQRERCSLSQEALALKANVDRTFVSQIERGIRQPTLTTLVKLAKALEVPPSKLISRTERALR